MSTSVAERRQAAERHFRDSGLPNRRVEEWKYSDLKGALGDVALPEIGAAGWTIEACSEAVELWDLADPNPPSWVSEHLGVLNGTDAPGNASLAFARAGFALRVPKNASGEARVRFTGAGQLRVLLMVEKGASLSFAECHDEASVRNVGMEILMCPDASFAHLRLAPRFSGVMLESIKALLRANCRYEAHFANFGAKLSRADLHLCIEGEGAQVNLSGVSVLAGADHADITTHIEHACGQSSSGQLFKYLVGGTARGVYQGRITVREGADGTDSSQTAKAFLAGTRAEADLKPELFIFAEDVKCAHGAAIGDLDMEALYYLRTRGIAEAEARDLLIRAFLGEAVDALTREDWRDEVWQAVETALPIAMEDGP